MQDNPDPGLFATEVRNCAGNTISVGVFSAKVSCIVASLSEASTDLETWICMISFFTRRIFSLIDASIQLSYVFALAKLT